MPNIEVTLDILAFGKMTQGHNDVIWVPVRRAENQ